MTRSRRMLALALFKRLHNGRYNHPTPIQLLENYVIEIGPMLIATTV